ncbi:MAG: excinuclease ABC subunit UvrC, partial [Acidobacteriota bacterium]|nr:excinuclease ABC subunit UvrC [Acidobacteriota bacterium]
CSAPCVGYITEAEYRENAANARLFLEGKSGPLLKALRRKMEGAAAGLRFEEAARWRDFIRTVEAIKSRPKFISTAKEDQDVVGFARKEDGTAAFYVFFMREGKVRDSKGVYVPAPAGGDDRRLLADFLKDFYGGRKDAPKKILLPFLPEDMADIENMLAGPEEPGTRIRAVRSGKSKELVDLANRNALSLIAKKELEASPLSELARVLGLDAPPLRIEGFDISNTLGQESVGSLVVFDDGRPNKDEYRKYRIKTVAGPNDVASLEEIVRRRYRRIIEEKKRLPDLVFVDGGKGQLQAARKALLSVGLAAVPAASLAKREEIIYTAAEPGGLSLERTSPALKLIQNIRDEAHRFAISFHRTRREKRSFASVLDGIAGIGPVKKKALLTAYRSAAEVASAPLEELAGIVGRRTADSVRAALAGED